MGRSDSPTQLVVDAGCDAGKTYFLRYLLIERIRLGLPVAVQIDAHTIILFEGKQPRHLDTRSEVQLPHDCWALLDLDLNLVTPCEAFLSSNAFIIMTSEPATRRWKGFRKQYGADLYIMDVWTDDELRKLLWVKPLRRRHKANLNEPSAYARPGGDWVQRGLALAAKWGPSPRYLLRMLYRPNQEAHYEAELDNDADSFVAGGTRSFSSVQGLDFLPMGCASELFFIRTTSPTERYRADVYVPTTTVAGLIAKSLCRTMTADRQLFFSQLQGQAATRSVARHVTELVFHKMLEGPSTRLTCRNVESPNEAPMLLVPHPEQAVLQGAIHALAEARSPCYFRPSDASLLGIDGLLLDGRNLYLLQLSLTTTCRSPITGIQQIADTVDATGRQFDWHVVLVGPKLEWAKQCAGRALSKLRDLDMKVWYCELNIENYFPLVSMASSHDRKPRSNPIRQV